ncbi:MAG: EcoKI restriction-modification system protein HsdS [Methanosaeta sp. PtaB.Bin039]|nr:MAG: EcoKI restriction-modification system protein HsdS [Methanosaeta sp. PtaB.Bin039]
MSKWLSRHLGDVCEINPKRNGAERLSPTAAVSFVPMAAIDESNGQISNAEARKLCDISGSYTPFQENDVLFAKITPSMENGKAAIAQGLVNGCGFGSTEFHVLRCRSDVLPQWVLAFIRQPWFRDAAKANFIGTAGQQRVPADFLRKVLIPIPSLSEQDQIVRILDKADVLRRLRAQANRRISQFTAALFEEMFGDPAQIPARWPIVPVSQFVSRFQAGRSIAPSGEDNCPSKYRILKVSAVTWGRFDPDESKPIPSTYTPAYDQFVRNGDLLFSRANTVDLIGATVRVDDTPGNLLLPDKLWRFVWKEPVEIELAFVLSLFQHPSIRRELSNRATGTGGSMKNISMDKVLTMMVPLPPPPLQRTFADYIAKIRELEKKQAASQQCLEDLFQSLLNRAFQGEL